jgi:hypothetical protein
VLLREPEATARGGSPLLLVERSEEVIVQLPGEHAKAPECLLPFRVSRTSADGGRWVAPALDEPALLELVQQSDQLAAVVAERVGDRALRLCVSPREHEQDRVVVRVQAGLLQASIACSFAA